MVCGDAGGQSKPRVARQRAVVDDPLFSLERTGFHGSSLSGSAKPPRGSRPKLFKRMQPQKASDSLMPPPQNAPGASMIYRYRSRKRFLPSLRTAIGQPYRTASLPTRIGVLKTSV